MSKLGRNPFEKAAAPKKSMKAAEIVREMNAAAEIASWHMDSSQPTEETVPAPPKTLAQQAARFVLVDLPAKSIVLGLKAYCLSISFLDRN